MQAQRATPIEITIARSMITFNYQGSDQRPLLKPHNQDRADALGWNINISASPRGTKQLTIAMNRASFASSGIMARRKKTTQSLKALKTMSYADMIRLAGLFVKAQLYYGYRLVNGKLDISKTPTYQVIESVRTLIEPIAHNIAQSMEGPRP